MAASSLRAPASAPQSCLPARPTPCTQPCCRGYPNEPARLRVRTHTAAAHERGPPIQPCPSARNRRSFARREILPRRSTRGWPTLPGPREIPDPLQESSPIGSAPYRTPAESRPGSADQPMTAFRGTCCPSRTANSVAPATSGERLANRLRRAGHDSVDAVHRFGIRIRTPMHGHELRQVNRGHTPGRHHVRTKAEIDVLALSVEGGRSVV